MLCQLCCCSSRGLPPLSPGERSGGAVVNRINCQSMCLDVERGNIETSIEEKRSCGTFPQSQTNTCYLHFNVLFCFHTWTYSWKKNWPSGCMSAVRVRIMLGTVFTHRVGSLPPCTHLFPLCYSLLLSIENNQTIPREQSAFFSYILVNILGSLN